MVRQFDVRRFLAGRPVGRACVLAGLVAVHLVDAPLADACSFADNSHRLDDSEVGVDTVAPTVAVESIEISQGRRDTSCADVGQIRVSIAEVSDDRTRAALMGYRLIVAGDTGRLELSDREGRTVRVDDNGEVYFRFRDANLGLPGEWDFTVQVVAVDLAGNVSEPTEPWRLEQSLAQDGCSLTPGGSRSSTLLPVLVALLWMRRRRA